MKIVHSGVVITLDKKDRKLIEDTISLLGKICDELGGYSNKENIHGYSCNMQELCDAHDRLVELWLHEEDDREYNFKNQGLRETARPAANFDKHKIKKVLDNLNTVQYTCIVRKRGNEK